MVRVSAISFLNTVPLMRGHQRDVEAVGRGMEVWFTTPSQCADQLRQGVADVGLIPAIEYQRIPGLSIVGNCAVATKGAVRSILLLTRKPLESVCTGNGNGNGVRLNLAVFSQAPPPIESCIRQ